MRILVCGGRAFANKQLVFDTIKEYDPSVVIQGGAIGADALARDWCKSTGTPCITMEAAWDYYRRAAGHIRNGWMLEFCKPEVVLAFPGGNGTKGMIEAARAKGIPVDVVKDD